MPTENRQDEFSKMMESSLASLQSEPNKSALAVGGATPAALSPNPAMQEVGVQFGNALQVVKGALGHISKGRGIGGLRMMNLPGLSGGMQNKVLRTVQEQLGKPSTTSVQPIETSNQPSVKPSAPSPTTVAPSAPLVGGAAAQSFGVTMSRGAFDDGETPHYQYGGMSVSLPSGIDLNDDEAVKNAIQSQNEMIDLFNKSEED